MRWTLIVVFACVSVAAAQQPPSASQPPSGVDISARDGDRIVVEDDARIHVVRRRQATIRTIYSRKERLLIVLVDYAKPGAFPDGQVDWAFNFYQVEGAWPLEPRWEAMTTMFQYEGEVSRPRGLAFETPRGLVQLVAGQPEAPARDPRAFAVLSHGGASNGPRRGLSFADAEKFQLADFVRSKASGATVITAMPPAGSGVTGSGRGAATVTLGVAGGIKRPNNAPRESGNVETNYSYAPLPDKITPPPAGEEIAASDGDRVILDDDARIHIVRRRQGTFRTIFNPEKRVLIVLADYAKPGQFPDGEVDSTLNFYELEGDWPLGSRWEGTTTLLKYEGDPQFSTGYALVTPQGLVHLSLGRPGLRKPDPAAAAVLWFRGSSIGHNRGWSFAQAEKFQLAEAENRDKQR
jgi:hypothetical protein